MVLVSTVVLWARQRPDALLGADSVPEAVFTVVLSAVPALALYLFTAWSAASVVIDGLLLTALFARTWWSSAVDTHSTASFGPGVAGWIFAPMLIGDTALVASGVRRVARGR